ncbi:proline racemase family protein [Sedimentibacter sp.]|uniref:proline racemase family protein n=1 Tax=Sedimentibacter sp. TaxID=1960295 RepID=UPI00289921CC|nr:proline racemase family protein [Sedimentibacter sp.]
MRFNEMIQTVDTHTGGEPTRIILSGIPVLKGNSVLEKRDYFKEKYDYIRKRLTYEPRGHAGMLCAAVVPPCDKRADFGIFYFDDVQYLDMCGHATIGVGTALAEIGMVPKEHMNSYIIETPAGLVTIKNNYIDGYVKSTSIQNVNSYVIDNEVFIDVEDVKNLKVEVAYGGNYFAIVPADTFNVKIIPESVNLIKHLSTKIIEACNEKLKDKKVKINLVQWYHDPFIKGANLRCVHSSGKGSPDRSPGGTGTSAKLAVLYLQGKLKINEPFVQESIIGGKFIGKILDIIQEGNITYIVPEITGEAKITGFHKFVFDETDELRDGFFFE